MPTMKPEEENKQEKKPQRVFGEEELQEEKSRPVKKNTAGAKKSAKDAQSSAADAKKKPGKKSASKKKKKGSSKETFMRMGKGLKTGSVTVTEYSKKAMHFFNTFTAGENPEQGAGRRFSAHFEWMSRFHFSSFIIATFVVLLITLTFFNNTNLQVVHSTVSIAGLSKDLEGYRILLLSDMHGREFGTKQATLLRAINGEDYDMVVLAGDMVGQKGDAQPLYDLLDGLGTSKPVYFVAGDSDPGPLREKPNVVEGTLEEFVLEDWVLGAIDRGAVYVDSPESLTVEDSTIWLTPENMLNVEASSTTSSLNKQAHLEADEVITGSNAAYDALPFTSYRQQNMQALLDATTEIGTEDLHISIGHIPPYSTPRVSDGTDGYLPTVDLILAGHNCGGVWKLPLLGAMYIPSVEAPRHGWFPARNEVEGLRMLGTVSLYVTGGLGVTDTVYLPDFRLYNQPKVSVLTLTAALTDDLLGIND